MGDGVSFRIIANQSPQVLPGGTIPQPRRIPARRVLGVLLGYACVWCLLDLSEFFQLAVACQLCVSYQDPVVRRLMQMVTMMPGEGGWFLTAVPPHIFAFLKPEFQW